MVSAEEDVESSSLRRAQRLAPRPEKDRVLPEEEQARLDFEFVQSAVRSPSLNGIYRGSSALCRT